MIFAHFDGDDVGPGLELLLLDDLIDEARAYSEGVNKGIAALLEIVSARPAADVIIAGGDDLVVCWPQESIETEQIEKMRHTFFTESGRTISAGVGSSLSEASANLRRAKLMGKDKVVAPAAILG
jgi:hypothetical protein